jgi:hypothetical protein
MVLDTVVVCCELWFVVLGGCVFPLPRLLTVVTAALVVVPIPCCLHGARFSTTNLDITQSFCSIGSTGGIEHDIGGCGFDRRGGGWFVHVASNQKRRCTDRPCQRCSTSWPQAPYHGMLHRCIGCSIGGGSSDSDSRAVLHVASRLGDLLLYCPIVVG